MAKYGAEWEIGTSNIVKLLKLVGIFKEAFCFQLYSDWCAVLIYNYDLV